MFSPCYAKRRASDKDLPIPIDHFDVVVFSCGLQVEDCDFVQFLLKMKLN